LPRFHHDLNKQDWTAFLSQLEAAAGRYTGPLSSNKCLKIWQLHPAPHKTNAPEADTDSATLRVLQNCQRCSWRPLLRDDNVMYSHLSQQYTPDDAMTTPGSHLNQRSLLYCTPFEKSGALQTSTQVVLCLILTAFTNYALLQCCACCCKVQAIRASQLHFEHHCDNTVY